MATLILPDHLQTQNTVSAFFLGGLMHGQRRDIPADKQTCHGFTPEGIELPHILYVRIAVPITDNDRVFGVLFIFVLHGTQRHDVQVFINDKISKLKYGMRKIVQQRLKANKRARMPLGAMQIGFTSEQLESLTTHYGVHFGEHIAEAMKSQPAA